MTIGAPPPEARKKPIHIPRSGWLFYCLILALVLNATEEGHPITHMVAQVAFYGLLVVAVCALSQDRRHLRVGFGLAATTAVLGAMATVHPTRGLILATLVAGLAFSAVMTMALFAHVLKAHHQVTGDVLYSAVTIFILAAVNWASLYLITEILWPGSLKGALGPHETLPLAFGDSLYFSTCVLTTIGFGDIAPVSPQARLLTSLEGLFGVMYPAVIIARLVGMYSISQPETPQDTDDDD